MKPCAIKWCVACREEGTEMCKIHQHYPIYKPSKLSIDPNAQYQGDKK